MNITLNISLGSFPALGAVGIVAVNDNKRAVRGCVHIGLNPETARLPAATKAAAVFPHLAPF